MNRKIKLIWDFRGEDALNMAKHHCIHLKEFTQLEELQYHQIDYVAYHPMYAIAFVSVDEKDMKIFRDALKPHRGELAE